MSSLRRLVVAFALASAVAAAAVPSGMAGGDVTRGPVVVRKDKTFGRVLVTRGHKALYYWDVEKRAHRIVCTGACLRRWPPLVVASRSAVPRTIAGVRGRFGVVKRPDGRLQVTHDGLALYTYVDDGPNQVLCDNFNRWFVVRA
jgi:predicted lipoprotein with Yx(FWY)xxD motif